MTFILAVLGVYRLAWMVSRENGPWNVMAHFRSFAFHRFGETHWITDGIHCPLCISFWLAVCWTIIPASLQWWFGIAGGVLLTHRIMEAISHES